MKSQRKALLFMLALTATNQSELSTRLTKSSFLQPHKRKVKSSLPTLSFLVGVCTFSSCPLALLQALRLFRHTCTIQIRLSGKLKRSINVKENANVLHATRPGCRRSYSKMANSQHFYCLYHDVCARLLNRKTTSAAIFFF